MKTNYLLPNQFKVIGWFLFIPGIILGLYFFLAMDMPEFLNITTFSIANEEFFGDPVYFSFVKNNVFDEIAGLLVVFGALFIAFSREKLEDEFIAKIRLESLVWATYINYIILILAIIFIYDMSFFLVLVLNMFTTLFFFIIRFNWRLMKSKNQIQDEE